MVFGKVSSQYKSAMVFKHSLDLRSSDFCNILLFLGSSSFEEKLTDRGIPLFILTI